MRRTPLGRTRLLRAARVVIPVLVASNLLVPRPVRAQDDPGTREAALPRIAVVPFFNASGDDADAWMGPGIADMLGGELARRFALETVDRAALRDQVAVTERTDAPALRALGTRVRAGWVVGGSYLRSGDKVRITAHLIETASGAVVRTATFEEQIADFATVPAQLASDFGPVLNVSASPDGAVAESPASPGAPPVVQVPARPGRLEAIDPLAPVDVTGAIALGPAVSAGAGGRPLVESLRAAEAPVIDGRLEEGEWSIAAHLTEFVQRSPVEGAPATERTDVYLAYDSANIYVGIHAHYSDLGLMRANRSDRDQLDRDDTVSIYFDPFLDQQRAYVFTINGYGVQGDSIVGSTGGGGGGFGGGGFGGGLPRGDASWDALFRSAGSLVEDGWVAELAIPFKSLRYPSRASGEPHRWGFQVGRTIQSKNEAVVWAPVTRSVAGFLTQMGELRGMTNLSTSRNLELLPTITAVQVGSLDRGRRRFVEDEFSAEAGIGVKYGVTSDLTADFTFNPDFSQIESDQPQIQVNQRFPLFFSELRPFFLEGQEIFATRGNVNLVHTRTIVDPRYGGKLTGKLGQATLGVLVANDESPGRVDDPAHPAFDRTASFFIGRVRYDLRAGSYIGAIVTDREFLDQYSRVGGVDARFRVGSTNDLDVRVAQAWSRVGGVARSGATFDIAWRHNGRNLEYDLDHTSVAPGFRTGTGFVRRTDVRRTEGRVSYRWWPEGWLTNWGPQFDYGRNYDYDGVLQDEAFGAGVQMQFSRNIRLNVDGGREMERFAGIDFWKGRRQVFAAVNTSRRLTFGGGMNWGDAIRYSEDPFLGRSQGGRLFVTVLPSSRLQTGLNVNFSRLVDPRTDAEVFDVKILRSQTSYQFTDRLLLRTIVEHNTFDRKFDGNVLLAYRVNAGTVFYLGYDDHYQQGDLIDQSIYPDSALRRTNRAFFTKFSYLFRY